MEFTSDFTIEDLGIVEDWVYDIEVQDNHNFFGNNILVHNSVYIQLGGVSEKLWNCSDNLTMDEKVNIIDEYCENVLKKEIQGYLDIVNSSLNALQPELIVEDREAISDCLSAKSTLKIVKDNKTELLTVRQLAEQSGMNVSSKVPDIKDIKDKNYQILSYNEITGQKELKQILNIQKKITTKRMVTLISPSGQKLKVTEDHLIAVKADNGDIYYKESKFITEEDFVKFEESLIKGIKTKYHNSQETIVYDIEVQDNHNFFVQGYLVHNCAVFLAKKKYYMRLRDNEGTRYPEDAPYIKKMGIDIIKSSTSVFSKKHLTDAIGIILDSTEAELFSWIEKVKEEYMKTPLEDIAETSTVAKISDPDWGTKKDGRTVSVPINSRAAVSTNNYISSRKLENQYTLINPGDKIKKLYMLEPNPVNSNIVGFIDSKFPELVKDYIDFDTNYDKFFKSKLEQMISSLGWDIYRTTGSLDDW